MKRVRLEECRAGKQPDGGIVYNTNAGTALPWLLFPKGPMYFSSQHNLLVGLFFLQNVDSNTDTCNLHKSGGHFFTLGHGQIVAP